MKTSISLSLILCLCSGLAARDLPVFYRAPLFPGYLNKKASSWTTKVSVDYATGSAKKGWNGKGHKVPLFTIFGPLDLVTWGLNIENPGTQTAALWGDNGTLNPNNPVARKGCDGLLQMCGTLSTEQVMIKAEQWLLWGFFVEALLPWRRVHIKRSGFRNLGANSFDVGGGVFDVNAFFKNDFVNVLKENGFCVPDRLCSIYEKSSGITDPTLSAGWAYSSDEIPEKLSCMRALFKIGVVFPAGGRRNEDHLFSIARGYNDHWAVKGHIQGELGMWKKLVLGALVDATIFFKDDCCLRMITSTCQSKTSLNQRQQGWIPLGKGHANVDPSVLWQLGAYAKGEDLWNGLSVLVGYTFTHHEPTRLHVEDCSFLKTFIANQIDSSNIQALQGCAVVDKRRVVCQDPIVNADRRLGGWEYHTIHTLVSLDTSTSINAWFAPTIAAEASFPVVGKNTFITDMYGASLSLQISWNL